jgi:sulfate-transporting ATPase
MAQYVFTMNRVGKIVPPKRQIIKDISLSFFPGAKIGLLGLNGSGKSTVLRIMAGLDTDIIGEATPMPNLKIGYLAAGTRARPRSDGPRGSRVRPRRRYCRPKPSWTTVYAAYAEPDADFDQARRGAGAP